MTERKAAWRVEWTGPDACPIDAHGRDFVTREAAVIRALALARQAGQPLQFSSADVAIGTRLRDGAQVVRVARVVVPDDAPVYGAHGYLL